MTFSSESHRFCDRVQDAYTLRCCPQVHGVVHDTLKFVRGILTDELNSATDNPVGSLAVVRLFSVSYLPYSDLRFALLMLIMSNAKMSHTKMNYITLIMVTMIVYVIIKTIITSVLRNNGIGS